MSCRKLDGSIDDTPAISKGIVAGRSVGNSEVSMMEGRGADSTIGSADNIVL